mgnify:CR=1 FL=1
MRVATRTVYIKDTDVEIVNRAAKLLAFHEDIGLGTLLTDQCRIIIKKYEPDNLLNPTQENER